MSYFSDLASSRRSIRKYEDKEIPLSEIEEIIRTATRAPSGCNSQCWNFVAIMDKAVIERIKDAVVKKSDELLRIKSNELSEEYLSGRRKLISFFAKAPVVIAVFMTKMDFHDPTFISALKANGYDDDEIKRLYAYPDLLSIGAAVQTLLLAAHEKGYGACWMNDPAIAADEIRDVLGLSADNKFISLIPVGIPAYTPRGKKMKDFNEIFSAR